MSRDGSLGALLLLGQLGLNLTGELVQVLAHTLHAKPLGVEKAAVLREEKAELSITALFLHKYWICFVTIIPRWKDYMFVKLDH